MMCPKCHTELETTAGVCPECGIRLLRTVSGIMKTSAVMIAARGERGFYQSVHDVPEPLRTQLLETTGSRNAGTIVIADRAGKEQLTRTMSRREAEHGEGAQAAVKAEVPGVPKTRPAGGVSWIAWVGLALVLACAVVIAALFYQHL